MRYNGGKHSCAKEISSIINSYNPRSYWEPFIGAANIIDKVIADKRLGTDLDQDIIILLSSVRDGWVPPCALTNQEYLMLKSGDKSPIRSFAKYGCSFGGKPWGGYARSGDRNYALNAKNSLLKQSPILKGIVFNCCDYRSMLNPSDYDVIYCDPPYANTTKVGIGTKFNTEEFFDWVRYNSQNSTILVSEQKAPSDFDCIWEKKITDGLGNRKITERLFKYKGV